MKLVAAGAAVVTAGYLVWGLRSLIVPATAGALLAYICRPLVSRLERRGLPRAAGVVVLLVMFATVALGTLHAVRIAVPSETQILGLRVRALYALNRHFQTLTGLDPSWTGGNHLYVIAHRELDGLMNHVSDMFALTPDERLRLIASLERDPTPGGEGSVRLLEQERANARVLEMRARRARPGDGATATSPGPASVSPPTGGAPDEPSGLADNVSRWMIAPVIFLFLLWDTGEIRRGLLAAVPNRLFEPALAVLTDVDEALGDYVRGISLECCALGLTVGVFVGIVGVPLKWAIAIGIFTGASNVIPYMGFAAALLGSLGYALLAENVHPLIPFATVDTFAIWVVAAVVLAELLKNVVFEPIVLGGSVKLHPLVVVIGVIGGAILFGPAGMFLAIPTITVARVLVASSARHLKAYGLI